MSVGKIDTNEELRREIDIHKLKHQSHMIDLGLILRGLLHYKRLYEQSPSTELLARLKEYHRQMDDFLSDRITNDLDQWFIDDFYIDSRKKELSGKWEVR